MTLRNWLLVLAPSLIVPLAFWAGFAGVVRSLPALQTFEVGILGVGLCGVAASRREWPLAGTVALLCVCAACRFSPAATALLGTGALLGWLAARDERTRAVLFAASSLFAYVGVALMLGVSQRWPLGHPNHLALWVGTVWAVQIGVLLTRPRSRVAIVNGVGLSVAMMVLVLGFHRGQSALVIAVVVVLVLSCLCKAAWRKWAIPAGVGGVLVLAFAFVSTGGIEWIDTLAGGKNLEPRLRIWRVALAGFAEAPLFGLGRWGMHYAMLADDWARLGYWGESDWFTEAGNAHNLLLQLGVQGGVVGLVAGTGAIGFTLLRARRLAADARAPLFGLAALLAISMVSAAPFGETGLLVAGTLLGFLAVTGATTTVRTSRNPRVAASVAAFAFFLLGVVRPIAHEASLHVQPQPERVGEALAWLVWSDGTYAAVVNHLRVELSSAKRYAELYELELDLIARYGPRRLSLSNAAMAAMAAGRTERATDHCVEHLRWDPLLYFPQCVSHLKAADQTEVATPTLLRGSGTLPRVHGSALELISGRESVDPERALALLARADTLELDELSYLVAAAQMGATGPAMAIRILELASRRAGDRFHLPARIAALRAGLQPPPPLSPATEAPATGAPTRSRATR